MSPQIQVKSVDIIEVTASPKRIVRVQSNKGTAVEIIGNGTVAIQPSANFVISNFGRGGEQAILRGRVAQLDGLRTTRAGESMRSMLLVDSQATGLPCMVHGALSEDEDVLQEGASLSFLQSFRILRLRNQKPYISLLEHDSGHPSHRLKVYVKVASGVIN
jgi:hypothetical protein